MAPDHTSPVSDSSPSIVTDSTLAQEQERTLNYLAAREVFLTWSIDECLEGVQSAWPLNKSVNSGETLPQPEGPDKNDPNEDLDTLAVGEEYWDASNPAPNIHIKMDPTFMTDWIKGYESDPAFCLIWNDKERKVQNWKNNG